MQNGMYEQNFEIIESVYLFVTKTTPKIKSNNKNTITPKIRFYFSSYTDDYV